KSWRPMSPLACAAAPCAAPQDAPGPGRAGSAVALLPGNNRHYGILATAHTQFVAHALAQVLRKAGFEVSLLQDVPAEGFGLDMYIVVCPQMFKQLPPGEKRIVFQMEQSVSPRWFTDDYLAILENSLSAWDYAPANLAFLETKGIRYPHTFLVPIGGVAAYSQLLQDCGEPALSPVEPNCDVLFYGDVNAPRRRRCCRPCSASSRCASRATCLAMPCARPCARRGWLSISTTTKAPCLRPPGIRMSEPGHARGDREQCRYPPACGLAGQPRAAGNAGGRRPGDGAGRAGDAGAAGALAGSAAARAGG
ncbi:hypothetical protein, partial [Comamonas sp. JC664]|uniref:hypothetical protein n=1 Tax=Comamonas sp. JC664 TaxID=2801917 RepID=UPI003613C0D2